MSIGSPDNGKNGINGPDHQSKSLDLGGDGTHYAALGQIFQPGS